MDTATACPATGRLALQPHTSPSTTLRCTPQPARSARPPLRNKRVVAWRPFWSWRGPPTSAWAWKRMSVEAHERGRRRAVSPVFAGGFHDPRVRCHRGWAIAYRRAHSCSPQFIQVASGPEFTFQQRGYVGASSWCQVGVQLTWRAHHKSFFEALTGRLSQDRLDRCDTSPSRRS